MKPTLPTIDDCWNRIGVNGDQSCPTLPAVIHCRNCPVYADAAQRNLQRPVSEDYRSEWAAHFSAPLAQAEATDHAALVFRLGREWLALPVASIDAIAPLAPGHKLPHRASAGLLGVVNVAGKVTPSIALDAILGVEAADDTMDDASRSRHIFPRLLVLRVDGQRYAMRVDELHGIARYAVASLAAPPATVNKGLARFVTGVLSIDTLRVGVLDSALLGQQLAECLR